MAWRVDPHERSLLLATVAVRLRDDFTGHPPSGVELELEQEVDGQWQATRRKVVRTPSGFAYFPNLGRARDPLSQPTRNYRVRVTWRLGRPLYAGAYPSGQAGAVFEVEAWNEDQLPASLPAPHDVFLLPGPNYPFPPSIWLLRGRVIDGDGVPVVDALIEQGSHERALSDERGEFALPLRRVPPGPVTIEFSDHLGQQVTHSLNVPDDLGTGHEITIA
jgi:hypothetical protein